MGEEMTRESEVLTLCTLKFGCFRVSVTLMKALALSRDRSVADCKTGDYPNLFCPLKFSSQDPGDERDSQAIPLVKRVEGSQQVILQQQACLGAASYAP